MLRPYKQSERDHIERMVRAAAFALKPDLVALRYDLIEDHSGEPAIDFKLVIADRLAYPTLDFERVRHLEDAIRAIVEPEEYALLGYFSVRSKREVSERPNDPQWKMEAA